MKLHDLMVKYGSDKATHGFCDFYESFFQPVREQVKSVLEIGVADGASIRGWLDYFPNAKVFGMDASSDAVGKYGDHHRWPSDKRFLPFMGDQADRQHLARLVEHGPWDIIIDDGGHTMEQQQVSLGVLFPHTRMFYVVEDLHTSFMDRIVLREKGKEVRSYPTGVGTVWTTHSLLSTLAQVRPSEPVAVGMGCMTDDELDFLLDTAPEVHIFDRDGDHKHMTSVLEVR